MGTSLPSRAARWQRSSAGDRPGSRSWNGRNHSVDWVPLLTTHPARALTVDQLIGTAPSSQAARRTSPCSVAWTGPAISLLQNRLADVEMVWIGGQLQYGNEFVVQMVRPTGC